MAGAYRSWSAKPTKSNMKSILPCRFDEKQKAYIKKIALQYNCTAAKAVRIIISHQMKFDEYKI